MENVSLQKRIIAVIADTHIPDRVSNLHPGLIPKLNESKVQLILHAGDQCSVSVMETLSKVAPVKAVRGNRDIFIRKMLPTKETIFINGVKIGLAHGFGNLWLYLFEKIQIMMHGYRLKKYLNLMVKTFPDANVLVFGHTHFPENVWVDGKLILNPGSAGIGYGKLNPSFAVLTIDSTGDVTSDIIYLENAKIIQRKWVEL